MSRARWAARMLACLGGAGLAAQQGGERLLQVAVTAAAERSVYLDHGRDAGVAIGAMVRLFPPGLPWLDVEVRAVSATSARGELPPGAAVPPVGTRGEVRVAAAPAGGGAAGGAPAHRPWARREPPRRADQPLLVPAFGQAPEERPLAVDGRLFAIAQWQRDEGGERRSDYLLTRLGTRLDATNALGAAERFRFAGELDDRRVRVADGPDQDDLTGRVDLASVAVGTEAFAPTGVEAGRFLSAHLPELGLVDGVEVVRRYEGGLRLGGGLGAYPRPFPQRESGDDIGVHAFVDYTSDPQRHFAGAVGVQKTWHRGAPDRDLLLLRAEARPAEHLSVFGTAKVDYYSGGDQVKGRGVELTEAFLSVRWDGERAGLGGSASQFRWPELLRREYQLLPVALVRDGRVDRVSLSGWVRPADWLRLQLRSDLWRDQLDSGAAYGADADLLGVLGAGSAGTVSLFTADGSAAGGPGGRIGFRDRLGDGSWRVGYRWLRYELDALVTGAETLTRQSVDLGIGWPLGSADLDLTAERWFGDREDAFWFGAYVQWRF